MSKLLVVILMLAATACAPAPRPAANYDPYAAQKAYWYAYGQSGGAVSFPQPVMIGNRTGFILPSPANGPVLIDMDDD